MTKNVLFIMCDQLRYDYLGCTGHPTIKTPNIDALAQRGVRFDRTYVQSPICGPSRMSYYTGRYVRSHGASWNNYPLRVGEWTLGDHLNCFGAKAVLCGKTHMQADVAGMERLGIDPESKKGKHIAEGGFEVWDRLDGLHPSGGKIPTHYNDYLRRQGFGGENPWQAWAASAVAPDGRALSGWWNENAHLPARIPAAHSETAYSTNRAMDFMEQAGDTPWCLHLSYIKPHWPLVAPAPYHSLYGPQDVIPPVRGEDPPAHPLYAANAKLRHSTVFADPEQRARMIATYMGLITELDDHIGRLMRWLDDTGRSSETMIIFTSDHGDYLGDHWMGEKEFFHDASARVPLIVVDPTEAADGTRGQVSDTLVEAIDLVPTIVEFMGGAPQPHILEGQSLMAWLHGDAPEWRHCVFSEADYSQSPIREMLGQPTSRCQAVMAFDGRYKFIKPDDFAVMLYDLQKDPNELHDIATMAASKPILDRMERHVSEWALSRCSRITISDEEIESQPPAEHQGIYIGYWQAD